MIHFLFSISECYTQPYKKFGAIVLLQLCNRIHMGLLGRNKEKIIVGTICPKCNMEFSEPGRTLRHIAKAHPKKRKIECNSCGFKN